MLTINNKQFRNLEEQVAYNTALLNLLPDGIIGSNFQGIITSISQLERGKVALYGTQAPYELFYRQENDVPISLGQFPREGEKGDTGAPGREGREGPQGTGWEVSPEDTPVAKAGTLFLNSTTGNVYQSNGEEWILQANLRGPQGLQGVQGPRGFTGSQGERGERGLRGASGMSYRITGEVDSVGQLPSPEGSLAYIVGADGSTKHLYIVVNGIWTDVGPITPSQIQLVNEAGYSEYSAISQLGATEIGMEASARGANGPKPYGVLTPFAWKKAVGKKWGEQANLIDSADDIAYEVYFGTNYSPDSKYFYYHINSPMYIRIVDDPAGPGVFHTMDAIYEASDRWGRFGDSLEWVRFTLPRNNPNNDFYVSTSAMALSGNRDSSYTTLSPTPRRRMNQGTIGAGGSADLTAQNLPVYFNNLTFTSNFMTGDGGLPPAETYTLMCRNTGNLVRFQYLGATREIQLSVDSTTIAVSVSDVLPPTGSITLSVQLLNDRVIGTYKVSRNKIRTVEIPHNFQLGGGATGFSIQAPVGTYYSMCCYVPPVPVYVIAMANQGFLNQITDNNVRVINCGVNNLANLSIYIRQLLMSVSHPSQITLVSSAIDPAGLDMWLDLVNFITSLGIHVSIATGDETTERLFSDSGVRTIYYAGRTNSTPAIADTIITQSLYNLI